MIITEEDLKMNPRLGLLVKQAETKVQSNKIVHQILQEQLKVKENKYNVSLKEYRTYKDGTQFASKGEMDRWDYLINIQKTGEIAELERQPVFILEDLYFHHQYGKVHSLSYVGDFKYKNISFRPECKGFYVVEDYKGPFISDVYKIKKKLFLRKYPEYYFFEV